jgi:steroid delta-isomerase-like uncharacterized protein
MTKDHMGHDPLGGDMKGVDSFKNHVQTLRTGFPDVIVTIDDIGSSGDEVFVRWTARATHKGLLAGIPATNKQCTVAGVTLNRFAEGKLAEQWYEWDTLGWLAQLGLMPSFDKLIEQQRGAQARP